MLANYKIGKTIYITEITGIFTVIKRVFKINLLVNFHVPIFRSVSSLTASSNFKVFHTSQYEQEKVVLKFSTKFPKFTSVFIQYTPFVVW